jgi:phosphoserine phosphatase RsbU/P
MDEQLNDAPCGFLTLSENSMMLSINHTLLKLLDYHVDQLRGSHINSILTVPARIFYQFYFVPLIKLENLIEEMHLSLQTSNGKEIPVIMNALPRKENGKNVIDCVLMPMRNRSKYENELLTAKKEAESALIAKHKANADLEDALNSLKQKQEELLKLNKQNQAYKVNTKRELELARKIQITSLTDPIINESIHIEAFYEASNELSGDIYGFYQLDEHRYGVILLDVMGHGISSALITMSLHSLFQRLIATGSNIEDVMKELDTHLHKLFQSNDEAWHYCTAINLLIDTHKQEIHYINAGHPPAFWQHPNGNLHELKSTTPPLGTFEDTLFKTNTLTYNKGGRLLLYTDGITDPLGEKHLYTLLMENSSQSIYTLKEKIIHSLKDQNHPYLKSDDQCFIIIHLK